MTGKPIMFPLFVLLSFCAGLAVLHASMASAAASSEEISRSTDSRGDALVTGHWYCVHLTLDKRRAWTTITADGAVRRTMADLGFAEPLAVYLDHDEGTGVWSASASGVYGVGPAPLPAADGTLAGGTATIVGGS